MRAVFGLVLLVGVALAGFAVYMARDYVSAYQNELAKERAAAAKIIKTVDVFAAKRPLKYGERITKEDVQLVKWPADFLPEGVFKAEEELFPQGDKELRVVLRAMETNEALMAIKVTEPGEDAGITSRLGRGMRAFAISVDVSSGVSGFLRPGDRVDVYWTGTAEQLGNGDITKLIESGVRLVAVDQTAGGEISGASIARTVTVAATPQQVAALAQAQASGKLSLALVGSDDDTIAEAVEVNQSSLLGIKTELVEEIAQEEVCTIKTRRGAEVIEIPIPCTE